jgi:hypothetical protein
MALFCCFAWILEHALQRYANGAWRCCSMLLDTIDDYQSAVCTAILGTCKRLLKRLVFVAAVLSGVAALQRVINLHQGAERSPCLRAASIAAKSFRLATCDSQRCKALNHHFGLVKN